MFDIGFWELTLIGVVALLVIGPERLPTVARTAGLWVGRMRRFVSSVKSDIDQQLKAEELQRIIKQQAGSAGLHEIHEIMEEANKAVEPLKQPADYLVKSDSNVAAAVPTDSGETGQQDDGNKV
jgi:sec-independent protein translocase protein TatB